MIKNADGIDALVYISEQTSPDESIVDNIKVTDNHGSFFVEFDSILHSFDCINRNDRSYMSSNVEECFQTERIQSMLHDNAWYGEMDHPLQITENGKLTPQRLQTIFMPNRSHKIMRPKFKNNLLYAHIQTASGTEAGAGFAKEIIQGLIPAFSCRAIATLQFIKGKPVVVCRKIITYDWVLYPSHKEAHIIGDATGTEKQIKTKTITESVKEKFKTFSQDIMIPVKELLENVGMDTNVNMVMESFDLSKDDIIGVDATGTRAIITDNNNTIYANMSPKTIKEVRDFYSSFNL